jgi:hypothetical protein
MTKILTLKRLVSCVLPMQNDMAPTHDDATQFDRDKLQQALTARANAVAARAVAKEHVETAESAAESVTEAATAASAARTAHIIFVQGFLERGEQMPPGADAELREADEAAARQLSQMRVQSEAAKGALPSLHARVQQAREDIGRADSDIDSAIGEILIATLQSRTRDAHEIVETLNRHLAEIIAVKDLLRRRGFYACNALGSIPDACVPLPKLKFTDEDLIANARPWKEFALRLRDDPNAAFE